MSHSIVCHHVVCCGQMNVESRDTLLLIGQCSLTAPAQHMALATSWHSAPYQRRQTGQYLPSIIQQFSWPFEVLGAFGFRWPASVSRHQLCVLCNLLGAPLNG